MKKRLLFWLLILAFFPSFSQDTLSLEQAVQLALDNNYGIKVARNNVTIAEQNAYPGNAGLLPSVDLNAGVTYSINNTNLEFAGDIPPNKTNGAESTSTNASVSVSYTIFDGLGNINNFRRLKENVGLSDEQARITIENTLLQIISNYYNLARFQQQAGVAKEALKLSRERLKRAQTQYEFGGGSRLAVLNAEVDLNTDSVALISTNLNVENAKRDLRFLMGDAAPTDFFASERVDFDEVKLTDLQAKAQQNNTAVKVAMYSQRLAEYDHKIAKSALYPRLSASASYGISNSQNEVGILLLNQNNGFTGNVSLSFNIFSGKQRKIQIQNAEVAIASRQEQLKEALRQIETEVGNSYATYQNQLYLLEIERENLAAADLNFERSEEAYKLGQINSTQFREAQLNLIRAKNRINDAQFNAKITELQLITLSGELLSEVKNE